MIGETVTRLRAAVVLDEYSEDLVATQWGDEENPPDPLEIPGCAFDPGRSDEPLADGRAAVVTQPTLYAPPTSDILAGDRIVVRGTTYNVDGSPADWRSPFTGVHRGITVGLKEVSG